LLEGFCPEPSQEEQIAVNSNGLMLFLRLADIEWMETADTGVKLRIGKQTHRLRDTLEALAAKLPPGRFLRISRSTLVNIEHIKGVQRMFFDEYEVVLRNGARLTLTRAYLENLRQIGLSLPALTRLRGLEGVTLRNPLEINAATSKVGTTNSLAGVHDLERKSWVVVAPATPV
jgi:hypothetical protein